MEIAVYCPFSSACILAQKASKAQPSNGIQNLHTGALCQHARRHEEGLRCYMLLTRGLGDDDSPSLSCNRMQRPKRLFSSSSAVITQRLEPAEKWC